MQNIIKSNCKYLKTKQSFMHSVEDSERWRTNKSSTSQYWCVKTMGVTGPDDAQVHPEECQEHRRCYISNQF